MKKNGSRENIILKLKLLLKKDAKRPGSLSAQKTLELWILRSMLCLLFFIILKINLIFGEYPEKFVKFKL